MPRRWIAACRARLAALLGRRRFEADLDEELRFHLDQAAAKHVRLGLSWEEARRAAARQLGDVTVTKEAVRLETGAAVFQDLERDLGHAIRQIRRLPAFAVTVIATIAICVATSTAVFSLVSAILWTPLPYPEPDRLVRLYNSYPNAGFPRTGTSVPEWFDWRERASTLADLAIYRQESNTVITAAGGRHAFALRVTPSFFTLLGATPVLGRVFEDADVETAGRRPVVISYDLWQTIFGGRTDVLDSTLVLDGAEYALLGVLSDRFQWPTWDAQVFTALRFGPRDRDMRARNTDTFEMIGRLRPGATAEAAQQEVNAINTATLATYPADRRRIVSDTGYTTMVRPYLDDLTRDVRRPLVLLWIGALLVLGIGLSNVTALLMLRAAARVREVALQLALGASRFRIIRQWLTEGLLLATAGAAAGLAGAHAGLRLLGAFEVYEIPRVGGVAIDGQAWLWTLAIVITVAVIAGVVPGWSAMRACSQLSPASSRTATSAATWPQRILVSSQIAFALTLAITAGLLAASFRNLVAVEPGFTPEDVSVAALILPGERYPGAAQRLDVLAKLEAAIASIPEVGHAAFASQLPFSGSDGRTALVPDGVSRPAGDVIGVPFHSIVSAGYFDAMRIRLRGGRGFSDADRFGAARVAIIDDVLEKRYWPDGAVGRRFWFGAAPGSPAEAVTIVGVVDSILQHSLRERATDGAIYSFVAQNPPGFVRLAVRFDEPVPWATVRDRIRSVDAALVPFWTESLSDSVNASLLFQRGPMQLLGLFSIVGLFLGALGVYGVLAHEFAARRREIAIRLAIGGSQRGIAALLWRRWAVLVGLGIAGGLAGAFGSSRLVESLLFDISPADPIVLLGAIGALLIAAALAAIDPARRALAVDPASMLRQE